MNSPHQDNPLSLPLRGWIRTCPEATKGDLGSEFDWTSAALYALLWALAGGIGYPPAD